jgi:predicted NAD/FAD-dependent oxidoreductase
MKAIVQPWQGKVQVIKSGRLSHQKRVTERWVGVPAMDVISAHLAAGIDILILILMFFKSMGHRPIDPIFYQTRHWRFAAAVNPLNVGCLWDAASKIGLCGDWCHMSRFEGAAPSGMAMAGRILGMNAGAPLKFKY